MIQQTTLIINRTRYLASVMCGSRRKYVAWPDRAEQTFELRNVTPRRLNLLPSKKNLSIIEFLAPYESAQTISISDWPLYNG